MSSSDEEIGDALVVEAAFAEKADLVGEHEDDLCGGEALLGTAGGFAELAGGAGDLVGGVDGLVLHRRPPDVLLHASSIRSIEMH